jgi:plastocyanin
MKAKLIAPAAALAVAALAATGCGGNDSNSNSGSGGSGSDTGAYGGSSGAKDTTTTDTTSSGGTSAGGGKGEQLTLSADPGGALKFDKSSLSAKAGTVTIVMDNPSSLPHAVAVEGNGVDKDGQTVQMGGKSTVTADLKAGEYTYYCPVPGHRQGGMEGKLTVK